MNQPARLHIWTSRVSVALSHSFLENFAFGIALLIFNLEPRHEALLFLPQSLFCSGIVSSAWFCSPSLASHPGAVASWMGSLFPVSILFLFSDLRLSSPYSRKALQAILTKHLFNHVWDCCYFLCLAMKTLIMLCIFNFSATLPHLFLSPFSTHSMAVFVHLLKPVFLKRFHRNSCADKLKQLQLCVFLGLAMTDFQRHALSSSSKYYLFPFSKGKAVCVSKIGKVFVKAENITNWGSIQHPYGNPSIMGSSLTCYVTRNSLKVTCFVVWHCGTAHQPLSNMSIPTWEHQFRSRLPC